jgi:flavin-dependent dehydrogenase
MSESERSAWDRVLEEIASPWDWVAAGAGAAAGAGLSIATSGGDVGTAVGTGAIAAVTLRKALIASLQGRTLRRRAKAFEEEIARHLSEEPALERLQRELERERGLWQSDAIDDDEFADQLHLMIQKYRRLFPGKKKTEAPRSIEAGGAGVAE